MIIGMDFGTTNSGMAIYDGQAVQVLPIDPANRNPRVARTALYIGNDQTIAIGREAVDRFFELNLGRPVRMERVWVGEVEVIAAGVQYTQDVYIWVDALSPGRLFLSLKTGLADSDYIGTVIDPYFYSLEDLIAIYLMVTRSRAEELLNRSLKRVVLGRPVRFSNDPQKDELAQQRLVDAALRAGYEEIYFQYEPVAAALYYEQSLQREENVLIFDFGGGTLDLTVMRLGDPARREVLATGGVTIAGDIFDQKLIRAKLPRHFGEGTIYGPSEKPLTVPAWVHNAFSNWQTILELQLPKNMQLLQTIARTARDPSGINALVGLVSGNYSLRMFDVVEQAKRRLSRRRATIIPLAGPGFDIREPVSRAEFEAIINRETRIISEEVERTVEASGLRPTEIDSVIRTGGSSQIPAFEALLKETFGPETVRAGNIFSSVTSGLGITAHNIETGQLESPQFGRSGQAYLNLDAGGQAVNRINLDLLKKRMALHEEMEESSDALSAEVSLVVVDEADEPTVVTIPRQSLTAEAGEGQPLPFTRLPANPLALRPVNPDGILLWLTSDYRFMLMTARQVETAHESGLTIDDVQRLDSRETVCTVDDWPALTRTDLLVIVTTEGMARPFRMAQLKPNVESPTPLQLDRRLPGQPAAVLGLSTEGEMLVISAGGRAARCASRDMSVQGSQILTRRSDDPVITALPVEADDQILIVTEEGYARRIQADWVSAVSGKPQSTSVISRRAVCGALLLKPGVTYRALVGGRLVPLDPERAPLGSAKSRKAERLLNLPKGETIAAVVALPAGEA